MDLKEVKVSFQQNTWSDISKEISINETLNLIKSNFLKDQVKILRTKLAEGDKDFYDANKRRLPAVTFCATFKKERKKENLKDYNSILVIDIDKLDEEKLKSLKKNLNEDEYVFSFWRSPSNKGFKGLLHVIYQNEFNKNDTDNQHKNSFKIISDYFLEKYNIEIDKSGSDITRLCFLSFDKELKLKENAKSFNIDNSAIISTKNEKTITLKIISNRDALYNPLDRNDNYDRKLMSKLIRYLNKENVTITENYLDWYRIAMAIANSFTFDVGLKYFIKISKRDSVKFDELKCTNFLSNCYRTRKGDITLASVIYFANNKGFKTKYQKNGVLKVEE